MQGSLLNIVVIAIILIASYTDAFTLTANRNVGIMARSSLEMRERKCDITGRRKNSDAMSVSKSNQRTHRTQGVNLQTKKLWWEEGNKFVKIRIAARTLKTIKKLGLNAVAKKYGINLDKFAISSGTGPRRPHPRDFLMDLAEEEVPQAA